MSLPLLPASTRALFAVYFLCLTGCATFSDSFSIIEHNLVMQQPGLALQALEKQGAGSQDRVLYLLNKGMLLRMNHDYAGSNEAFEAAKQRIGALYGVSVHEQLTSFMVNDSVQSFVGEEFEQTLIHLYLALNYLETGQPDKARVEALQIDIKLREQAEKARGNSYTEDAFARYLTGMIYEGLGEWSDAMIAYRSAYEAYTKYREKYGVAVPVFLKYDLLRLAQRQGLSDEVQKYKAAFSINTWPSEASLRDTGELVFMLHNGLAPIKREHSVVVNNPATGRLLRISVPQYQSRFTPVTKARITVNKKETVTEAVENIDGIAIKSLEAKMPAITARLLARAVVKDQAAKQAGKQNDLAGLIMNVTNVLTERADTRSWLTLPHNILLARASLAPGRYTAKVELLGNNNEVIATHEFADVVINQQKKTYLSYHWVSAQSQFVRR
jgi:uncharacterized protein